MEGLEHTIHFTPGIGESPVDLGFVGFITGMSIAQSFYKIKKSTKKYHFEQNKKKKEPENALFSGSNTKMKHLKPKFYFTNRRFQLVLNSSILKTFDYRTF